MSLLGNHVLPLRLGEALRVDQRAAPHRSAAGPATASAVALRAADLLAVLVLAAVAGAGAARSTRPADRSGPRGGSRRPDGRWRSAWAGRRLRPPARRSRLPCPPRSAAAARGRLGARGRGRLARSPGPPASTLALARRSRVTAVTIAAQTVAVTPGGFGTYEAAATAAMVGVGVPRRAGLRGRADDPRGEDGVRAGGRRRRAGRAGARRTGAGCGSPAPVPRPAGPAAGGRRTHRWWSSSRCTTRRTPSARVVAASARRCTAARCGVSSSTTARPTTRPREAARRRRRGGRRSRATSGSAPRCAAGWPRRAPAAPGRGGLPRRRRRVLPRGHRRWSSRPVLDGIGRLRRRLAVRRRHPAHAAAPAARQPGADPVGALADPPAATSPTGRAATARSPRRRRPTPRSCTTTTTRRC